MLVADDVKEIRAAQKEKSANTARHLADKYGVNVGAIYAVWSRRTWANRKRNYGPRKKDEGITALSTSAAATVSRQSQEIYT